MLLSVANANSCKTSLRHHNGTFALTGTAKHSGYFFEALSSTIVKIPL